MDSFCLIPALLEKGCEINGSMKIFSCPKTFLDLISAISKISWGYLNQTSETFQYSWEQNNDSA